MPIRSAVHMDKALADLDERSQSAPRANRAWTRHLRRDANIAATKGAAVLAISQFSAVYRRPCAVGVRGTSGAREHCGGARGSTGSCHLINTPRLPTFFGRATIAFDGHAELRELARALRNRCRDAMDTGETTPFPSIAPFVTHVVGHFALEEGDAYFGVLASDVPELSDPIGRLVADHRAMEEELARLAASAELKPAPTTFPAELARFIDRLEAHERGESALLESFFFGDERPVS